MIDMVTIWSRDPVLQRAYWLTYVQVFVIGQSDYKTYFCLKDSQLNTTFNGSTQNSARAREPSLNGAYDYKGKVIKKLKQMATKVFEWSYFCTSRRQCRDFFP